MVPLITNILEGLWNLKFLVGYRTKVARFLIGGIAFYQWLSTAPQALPTLPDLSPAISGPVLIYLAAQITKFSAEHKP